VGCVTAPIQELAKGYSVALEQYLSQPEEVGLLRAYEIGRQALANDSGVLDMATMHSRALADALKGSHTDEERERRLAAATDFFVEALSPFEMALRAVRDANAVLRRLNDMLEGQAKRIASALHDEAAQLLASVHLALADAASELKPAEVKRLAAVQGLLNQIEARLRNLSHELRPPILEDLGLSAALEFLADSVSKRWGLPVTVTASLSGDVSSTVETTVYRIAQEALTNAAKHARATRAEVDLRQSGQRIFCSVRDDGVGLEASAAAVPGHRAGLGLLEIKERVTALGGTLRLSPNHDRGTDLTFELPLEG
jgi:signal transduction histidine kinase